jgi:dihydrolipoamide dehydrogenase
VIVATGSKPRALPGVRVDNVRVLDNDGALAIPTCRSSSAWSAPA